MRDSFSKQRADMVTYQIERRGIVDERILTAMRKIPRHHFIPEEQWENAYDDFPLPIGDGQTISQPYIVAYMSNILDILESEKVLEIGTGSGYQAAILGSLAECVFTVERIPQLAERASQRLQELKIKNVTVVVGDGSLGLPSEAPFDAILVTAAAPAAPQILLDQLAEGGRMVIPVGNRFHQTLELWMRKKGRLTRQEVLPVVFVPLIGEQGWKREDW